MTSAFTARDRRRVAAPPTTSSLVAVSPLAAALAIVLIWAADGGGFAATVWYPAGLVVLGILATVWIVEPARVLSLDAPIKLTLALFGGFTAWSYASIAWATSSADAWEGANRTMLYLALFALFATARISTDTTVALVMVYAAGIAVLGLVTIERALHSAHPADFFLYGRLSQPTGYSNATAALFLIPVWPLLAICAARHRPALLRGAGIAIAGVLVELSLIPQSRGAAFALPIIALLYLLAVPQRLRGGILLALVGAAVGLSLHRLLAVFPASPGEPSSVHALVSARNALLLSLVALFAIGSLLAAADARLDAPHRLVSVVKPASAILLAAALLSLGSYGLVSLGGPREAVTRGWHSFRGGYPADGSRFAGLGSNRYDFWRVSLNVFRHHPVGGIGSDNFAAAYLKARRSQEEPLYPHSIEMRLLEETGVVGTLLFVGMLAFACFGALAGGRRGLAAGADRTLRYGLIVGVAYWLLHSSADWLWAFPALSGAAFVLLGLAVASKTPPQPGATRSRAGRALAAGTAAAAVLAVASFTLPWLATREVNAAAASWRADPQLAFSRLSAARRLNVLSDEPDVVGAAIASRRHDYPEMRRSLLSAISRNPDNWYSRLELAAAESMLGDRGAAATAAEAARRLNPHEPLVSYALRRLAHGQRVDPDRLDHALLARVHSMH